MRKLRRKARQLSRMTEGERAQRDRYVGAIMDGAGHHAALAAAKGQAFDPAAPPQPPAPPQGRKQMIETLEAMGVTVDRRWGDARLGQMLEDQAG